MNRRVVVTGVGLVSPFYIGSDLCEFLDENLNDYKFEDSLVVNNLEDSLEHYVPHNLLRRMCRFSQLTLFSNVLCYKDSGIHIKEQSDRIGSLANTSYGPLSVTESILQTLIDGKPQNVSPMGFSNTVMNCATGQVSMFLGLKGVSSTLVGSSVITYAYDQISNGKADAIFVSGTEEMNSHLQEAMRNNGLTIAENSACILLESYEHATQRNAKIYSEILGCGVHIGEKSALTDSFSQAIETIPYDKKSAYGIFLNSETNMDNAFEQQIEMTRKSFDCTKLFHRALGASEVISALCAAAFLQSNNFVENVNCENKICTLDADLIVSWCIQHGKCCSTVVQGGLGYV